jgi:hypothetical protein
MAFFANALPVSLIKSRQPLLEQTLSTQACRPSFICIPSIDQQINEQLSSPRIEPIAERLTQDIQRLDRNMNIIEKDLPGRIQARVGPVEITDWFSIIPVTYLVDLIEAFQVLVDIILAFWLPYRLSVRPARPQDKSAMGLE